MERIARPSSSPEADRLRALRRYQILDTSPEESFDRITRLAAHLFDVPVVLVTLVDKDRQWHKSCYGVDVRDVDRNHSFCAYNLVGDEVMVVEDARADDRFANNPLVTGPPHIRFYAGAPLVTSDGFTLGSLCVIDHAPRSFSAEQQEQLRDLAAMVLDELRLRREVAERRQIQDALQASEQRFRGLVSNLPGLVYRCTYDSVWTTLYMSHGRKKIAGYPVDAFERGKRSFKEIVHKDDLQKVLDAVREAVETRSHFEVEYRVHAPDGTIRWIEDIGRPCLNEDGRVQWLDGVMFDVTERKQTEERLRLLETAVNDATESVLITDSELDEPGPRIVYANPGFQAMTGYDLDDVVGETPRILQGPETDAELLDELRVLLEEGDSFFGETINYRKDGTPFVNEWSISPVYDDAGTVTHYVAVQRDITTRKEVERALKASEQKYRTVVENVRDVVFRTDAEGHFMFLNPAWTDLTGYAIEDSLGKPFGDYTVSEADSDGHGAFEAMLGKQRDFCRYTVQLKTRGEAPRWMEVFARPVFDDEGQIVSTSGTLHDVTTWREAEEQMRAALEKERELGRLKSRFVSMASHELRTPLATIQSSAELAALFMERGADEKSTKHLGRIEDNVQRMTTLLEDVLIFGRVEEGRLPFDPKPMDLSPLTREMVSNVQQGVGNGHYIQSDGVDDAHPMTADPKLIRLILTNLLTNAVKYSEEGSCVQLSVAREGEHTRIAVEDEGIGIPEADLDRLFEPFHRAENVGTRRGTGLGLSILKEVADLHGGQVGVESTEGEGSTFWVVLPHHPPAETAESTE